MYFEVVLEGVIESDRLGRGMESRGPKSKCLERERESGKKKRERERLGVKYFYAYCSLINCYVVHI